MTIIFERILSSDPRSTLQMQRGEINRSAVVLNVNGAQREFTVFVRANVLPHLDASVAYGDELLEELLRFEPAALSTLLSSVAKLRRGAEVSLPIVLLRAEDQHAEAL